MLYKGPKVPLPFLEEPLAILVKALDRGGLASIASQRTWLNPALRSKSLAESIFPFYRLMYDCIPLGGT